MAATMEANHGLLQDVLARSTVLQALVNANNFNVNAPGNLLFMSRDFDRLDASPVNFDLNGDGRINNGTELIGLSDSTAAENPLLMGSNGNERTLWIGNLTANSAAYRKVSNDVKFRRHA
ncbi:hypothetical protein [Aquabacterium sp.]|uniref:hypothetical protein n=1 Tax=Aquabacterium sp. TaxID=1872578 RepID=UPI0040377671